MPRKHAYAQTFALLAALALLSGCASIPAYKQQHLSKPGMTFSDSPAANTDSTLTAQMEPGSQTSGGAQASGCTACR